jgi:hypothetical protein
MNTGAGSQPGMGDDPALDVPADAPPAGTTGGGSPDETPGTPPPENSLDDGLFDEVVRVFDDGVTYAQAELGFQKTRAKLAGRAAGMAALYVTIALVLVHIALLALAVGLVIALAPFVTIWGAIAIVVGVILLGAVWLLLKARAKADKITALFTPDAEA